MKRPAVLVASITLAATATLGCADGKPAPVPAAEFGHRLFSDPRMSDSQFNDFSCATCHATRPGTGPAPIFPGHTLVDSAFRPTFWGGYERRLLDATNFCFVYFMRGTTLPADDPRAKALYEYLVSISPTRSADALPLTIVKDAKDVRSPEAPGDAAAGAAIYKRACQICHGPGGSHRVGIGMAPPLPETTKTFGMEFPKNTPAEVVVEKVRHGQFFQVGGNMPLYSLEALPDADLGNLLTFLGL